MAYLLEIQEHHKQHLLQYLKGLEYVNLNELDVDNMLKQMNLSQEDKDNIQSIKNGILEARLAELGLLKLQSAEDFVNEL